jgi:hypothetical protein
MADRQQDKIEHRVGVNRDLRAQHQRWTFSSREDRQGVADGLVLDAEAIGVHLEQDAMLPPARWAASVAGTPASDHRETAARRWSYGRRASGEAYWTGVSAVLGTLPDFPIPGVLGLVAVRTS